MRQIVLDTETTGTDWKTGDRVIEIGAVELVRRRPTGRTFQRYLNPDGRDSHPDALRVHGLTTEFLSDKPRFAEVVDEFLAFVDGAELLIHNAAFDLGFLQNELALLDGPARSLLDMCTVEDTWKLARTLYPGQRTGLDALCKRLGVDNTQRQFHGALLDAQLLADVYLAMTSGQGEIGFAERNHTPAVTVAMPGTPVSASRPRVLVDDADAQAHAARLEALAARGHCLWLQLESATPH